MQTNFIDLRETKTKLEGVTKFDKATNVYFKIVDAFNKPTKFKNVALICIDQNFGAIFKTWYDDETDCDLYFGHAGKEFNQ